MWGIAMVWNSSGGGGPWGGGSGGGGNGGNPWGGRPSGGGPRQPPDLDEIIRKGQDSLKNMVPPGGLGGVRGIALLAIVAVGAWLATGFYRVDTEEQGVELVFGKYAGFTYPGLHYNWPAPIGKVYTPGVTRINRVELGFNTPSEPRGRGLPGRSAASDSLMLTGDENIVDINFTVFWRIKDAGAYLFKVRDPVGTVKVASESAMRDIIGQTPIQVALTEGRQPIEHKVRDLLQQRLDSYGAGIEVQQVQLLKTDPPSVVVDSFNDVQRARADRERLRNEAEAYRNDIIPRARGEAERLLQESQAYREQVVNLAQGDASRFLAVLNAYKVAKDVTVQRLYLETMEEILSGAPKMIVDGKAGGGVLPYLPLDQLKPRANAKPGAQPQIPAQNQGVKP
jgi:membrane protease subunit HflK